MEPLLAGAPLVRGDWEVHLRVQGPPPTPAPITCDSWVQGYLLQQGERGKGPHQCSTCLPGEGPCGVQLRAGGLPQHASLQTLDAGQTGGQAGLLDHVGKRRRLRPGLGSEGTPQNPQIGSNSQGWGKPTGDYLGASGSPSP